PRVARGRKVQYLVTDRNSDAEGLVGAAPAKDAERQILQREIRFGIVRAGDPATERRVVSLVDLRNHTSPSASSSATRSSKEQEPNESTNSRRARAISTWRTRWFRQERPSPSKRSASGDVSSSSATASLSGRPVQTRTAAASRLRNPCIGAVGLSGA